MPIEDLRDHPKIKAMPVAGRGMVYELCFHFWEIECQPVKLDFDSLFLASNAHRPTFSRYYIELVDIFNDIRPRLEVAWRARSSNNQSLRDMRARLTAMQRRSKLVVEETPAPALATVKHGWRRKEELTKRFEVGAERFEEAAEMEISGNDEKSGFRD